MGKLADFGNTIQHNPVILVAGLELLFVVLLLFVFKVDFPSQLRDIIKDAFIAWNGALALAINIMRDKAYVHLEQKNDGDGTTNIVDKS